MKRKLLLFFLLALLLTLSVRAAGAVRLDELGMRLEIPDGYTVITRNMAPDDPALAIFDMDSDQVTALLEDGDIYLDLMDENPDFEYSITMTSNEVKSMSQFSDDVLDDMEDTLREQYESADVTVKEVEHLFNGQAVFFRVLVSGEQNGEQVQLLRYYTVHNYQAIYMTLQYWGAEIPEKYQQLAQDILYSVQFDEPDLYSSSDSSETASSDDTSSQSSSGPIEQMLAPKPSADDYETSTQTPAPVKKQGVPLQILLPVALGLIVAGVIAWLIVRGKKRTRQQTDAAPAAKAKKK